MLKTFSLSDVGKKRTMNQDYICTSETPVGNLPNLFALADGMGGYNGGEYASARTVEIVSSFIEKSKNTTPRKLFTEAVREANRVIRTEASENPEYDRMGTTLVLASIVGDCLQVANVGDSRLYVIGDDIKQITVDHSYVEEMIKMGSLDRESARTHPQKNIITRAVGADDTIDTDFFKATAKQQKPKSIKEKLLGRLTGALVTGLLGVAFLIVGFVLCNNPGMDDEALLTIFVFGGILLAIGAALLAVYFVGKRMLAKEMAAEEKALEC